MRSRKQIQTSRVNGTESRGPVIIAGKPDAPATGSNAVSAFPTSTPNSATTLSTLSTRPNSTTFGQPVSPIQDKRTTSHRHPRAPSHRSPATSGPSAKLKRKNGIPRPDACNTGAQTAPEKNSQGESRAADRERLHRNSRDLCLLKNDQTNRSKAPGERQAGEVKLPNNPRTVADPALRAPIQRSKIPSPEKFQITNEPTITHKTSSLPKSPTRAKPKAQEIP